MGAIWHPKLAVPCFSAGMALLLGAMGALLGDIELLAALGLLNLGCAGLNIWIDGQILFPPPSQ